MAETQIHATRVCSKCGVEKMLTAENFQTKRGGNAGKIYYMQRCRPCQSEVKRGYNQRYFAENRDKLLADMKAWNAANPDYEKSRWPKRKEAASAYKKRRWADMSPQERIDKRLQVEQWKADNPEKARNIETRRLARTRASSELRAQATEKMRNWREKNPEAAAAARDRRRARDVGAEGTYSREDVRALLKTQGRVCFYCTRLLTKFECDHFIPLARGGTNWPSNLRLSCSSCNASKGAKLPWEWMPERFPPP